MELLSHIRHRRTRALLSSYIDGEVSAAERRRVEAHAAGCSECRDEIESLRATVELVRALPDLELPRSFELTRLPERQPRVSFGVWAPRLATSVAGLLLVALLAADFAGTLAQSGGFDEEAAEMQLAAPAPAAPAAMAQAAEASAPQQSQAAAAPPMAAQAAPTQPVQLMSSDTDAATPEASEAAQAPPAAPAAAMARQSDPAAATPEAAAQTPAPVAKAFGRAAAEPSPELQAAAGETDAEEQPDAPAEPAAADVTGPPGEPGAAADEVWEPADEEGGLDFSLRQLQVAAAVSFLALAAVTIWLARRRRRAGV